MREDDNPREHLERISNHVEILEGMVMSIGEYPLLAHKDEDYMSSIMNDSDKGKALSKWKNKFLAVCYLSTLDKKRYGSLIENLGNDYSMGNDKYPEDLTSAYNYALHYKNYDPPTEAILNSEKGLSFAQKGKTCWTCSKEGYTKCNCPDCKKKKESKEEDEDPGEQDSNANEEDSTTGNNGVAGLNCAQEVEPEEGFFKL